MAGRLEIPACVCCRAVLPSSGRRGTNHSNEEVKTDRRQTDRPTLVYPDPTQPTPSNTSPLAPPPPPCIPRPDPTNPLKHIHTRPPPPPSPLYTPTRPNQLPQTLPHSPSPSPLYTPTRPNQPPQTLPTRPPPPPFQFAPRSRTTAPSLIEKSTHSRNYSPFYS
ncbi:hypothetical protein Pcinc_028765 [Petrolisthes cinctipes]|uniref:Uncharacterized protein n=1 Tax=Petrolisthes cinctipes TaxID=88211 RepID=A0AAE1F289_PETCI|nr:hypothetical protein Pcinc_028765 [Petrolisthes cinctipes]